MRLTHLMESMAATMFPNLHEIDPFNRVGGCRYVPGEDVVSVHNQRGFSPTAATNQILNKYIFNIYIFFILL